MINNVFAVNITSMRLKKEWSQEDLAGFMNVTRQAVSKWETGASIPDIELLLKLSKLFSVTINDLFEKVVQGEVHSIDEIAHVAPDDLRQVLINFSFEEMIKLAKGLSPEAFEAINHVMTATDFKTNVVNFKPVRLTEVEALHEKLVSELNLYFHSKQLPLSH